MAADQPIEPNPISRGKQEDQKAVILPVNTFSIKKSIS